MRGFEWTNQRGIEGTGFVRALRTHLTFHLPALTPDLMKNIRSTLEKEVGKQTADAGTFCHSLTQYIFLVSATQYIIGYLKFSIFSTAKQIVNGSNSLVFFGDELYE